MRYPMRPSSRISSDKENEFAGGSVEDNSSSCGSDNSIDFGSHQSESRSFREFSSSEDYLFAMKEDLAEWLNALYSIEIDVETFMTKLECGTVLCRHANNVNSIAREKLEQGQQLTGWTPPKKDLRYRQNAKPGTFLARDNVSNFIDWCRTGINVRECLLFETDDLVLRKNEANFVLCLLDVARKGSQLSMPVPLLVQMEREIDLELEAEQRIQKDELLNGGSGTSSGEEDILVPQIITNDLRNLHERVVDLLNRCNCPAQFPMIQLADGKYRIGDSKQIVYLRILRRHVMVRVGGGWDTLEHYLEKHDPCRHRGHRYSKSSAKLILNRDKYGASPTLLASYSRY